MGKRFNLIGFDFNNIDTKQYRHCSIHLYKRLIESNSDSTLLFCPECGSEYPIKETVKEQAIQTEHQASQETKIVQARKKRKYYDSFANLIPEDDIDAIRDMQGGRRIVYYREDKTSNDNNKDAYVVSK